MTTTAPSPTAGASTLPQSPSADSMAALKRALDEDGVAVFPGVLTHEECDDYVTQLHEWLAKFGPKGFPEARNSIINKYNVSQHPVAWATRLKAAPVFESLWGTEKVTTSMDAMAIGHPPELGRNSFADGKPLGLHIDQGGEKLGLHAYQGAVYLEDADEDDWCFAVLNGSHEYHAKYYANRTKKPPWTEFLRLTKTEVTWYQAQGCDIRLVAVPKGGLVLWDSRTVHAGAPPHMHRKHPARWRYVVFVCMVPAIWASDEDMAKKRNAYNKLQITKHWPAQGFGTFKSQPMPAELNAVNELPDIALTEKARLLAGVLSYDFDDDKPNGPADKPLLKVKPSLKPVTPTPQAAEQATDESKRKPAGSAGNASKRRKVSPTNQKTESAGTEAATGKRKAHTPLSHIKTRQQHKKKSSVKIS